VDTKTNARDGPHLLKPVGACVSPDSQDNLDARLWFNCVEEMVFTDADFCSDTESADETDPSSTMLSILPKLQALQAAYVVCLYQNWEGADASKRRIRRHRFSTVVSVGCQQCFRARLAHGLT
jgi:hypothetical protein